MKKIIVLILITFLSFSLFAGAPGVNPKRGGFGIDMASTFYNFEDNYSSIRYSGSADGYNTYGDDHIVALGGVWKMDSEQNESQHEMVVTVTCPNGFYFESISNPGARRPFELYAVINESYSNSSGNSGETDNNGRTHNNYVRKRLAEGENVFDYTYDFITPSNKWDTEWINSEYHVHPARRLDEDYKYQYMWFDLVLCLPYDGTQGTSYVSSDGRMNYNGRSYNLIEADDYSAIITVRVEWNGQVAETTIPLGGYYSKNITSMDTTTSLSVRPMASASNLSIETMQGVQVDIADINFMAIGTIYETETYEHDYGYDWTSWDDETTFTINTYHNQPSYYLFLSASRNPFEEDSEGFRLVRTNRGYSESPYSEDYVGFDLRLTTNVISDDSVSSGSYKDFDGTDYMLDSNTLSDAIKIPFKGYGGTGDTVRYAQYEGTVSIIMDQKNTIMNDGLYQEEVYVHIVSNSEGEIDFLLDSWQETYSGIITERPST